ncbi:restriction endonuclease subunit S [Treponema primitia]|uniref:restriction endonuclease subunit S n=1 Tax=Treponema primitia TaxID=88058 RepID=UPI00025550A7|nr:restriction endonuclease subunit S [Treponema primitia]
MIYNETKFNAHWDTKKLNQLGIFSRGKSKHRPRNDKILFSNGRYPLIQTGDVKSANLFISKHSQNYNEYGLKQSKLWDTGTLCITIAANIAETGILTYPMCFPDSVVGFNADKNESSEYFMHYVFKYIRNSIQNSVQGSIQDNINIDYLSLLEFKIPQKKYQDKIVHLLLSIDKKIEFNNKINAELESILKNIYDYWFIQFDFPDKKGKPYKSSGGKMVRNEELKKEIPEGWNSIQINNILQKVPKRERIQNSEILKIGLYPVIDQSENFIAGFTNNKASVYMYNIPYIIFGDHTRIIKIINFDFARGADGTQVLISNNCRMPQFLLYYIVKNIDLSNYGYARHFKYLKDYKVILPDERIGHEFNNLANNFYTKIKQNVFENQQLISLRDWLLPMLMNGQVVIK